MDSKNEIAKYLKELTDTTKFSHEQTIINLKDCLKDKKCCIFSCGANIIEHSDKFEQIKNDKTLITCCIKSAIEQLDFETDILALFECVNGTYLNNDKIKNIFILKTKTFAYDNISYNLDNFKIGGFVIDIYSVINFLIYVGVKEIYLFGFYLADYIINDLTNYNYYDDIVCKKFHTYDEAFSRLKEPGVLREHIEGSKISQYCFDNNISIYNVSEEGCVSNKIKRINFESVFTNKKTFVSSKIAYRDLLDEIDDKVDIDFYYERNCNNNIDNNNITLFEKKRKVLNHLLLEGIYCLKKVNEHDTKNEINLNKFMKDILCVFSYISLYVCDKLFVSAFFSHYLLKFNKVFGVCFYKDFDKISCPNFYDELLLLHISDINNIDFDMFYSHFNMTKYNQHKYFKLLCYLVYIKNVKNIPEDFVAIEYKEIHEDLQHMTDLQARIHYEDSGHKENRKYKYENIPEDFVAKEYKAIHEDLQHMTDLQAKIHYEYDGYKKNRKYKYENIPDDFVAKEYKELNEDLQHMTDLQARIHYEDNGHKENRKYKYENIPEDFK